jgi:hypothetical protein
VNGKLDRVEEFEKKDEELKEKIEAIIKEMEL